MKDTLQRNQASHTLSLEAKETSLNTWMKRCDSLVTVRYWTKMLDISRVTSLVRVKRCGVSSQPRPLPFAATDSLKKL